MIKNPSFGAALKSLWHDRCTVSTMQNSEKANSAFTQQTETVLFANEPCRLSHKTVTIATDVANAARTFQQTVLFLQEHKLYDYEQLTQKAEASKDQFNILSAQIKDAEKRMAEISVMKKQLINYSKTRQVY